MSSFATESDQTEALAPVIAAALPANIPADAPGPESNTFTGLGGVRAAAKRYLAAGMQPVPMLPSDKKPAVKWKEFTCTPGNDVTSGYLQITVKRLREPMEEIESFLLKFANETSHPFFSGYILFLPATVGVDLNS